MVLGATFPELFGQLASKGASIKLSQSIQTIQSEWLNELHLPKLS